MQRALQQWLEGAGVTEYPHSGQEADAFYVTYNGTTIIVVIKKFCAQKAQRDAIQQIHQLVSNI